MRTAGFSAIHVKMTLDGIKRTPVIARAIERWAEGHNLFIHGPAGTGKTYAAVAMLRDFVTRTGSQGKLYRVPELMSDLRVAAGRHEDDALVDGISGSAALVIDDLGVGRASEFVLENLYLIIDRWYCDEKKNLIITSNLSLGDLSARLDDRIASRIAGMCDVIELVGDDRRIKGL